MAILDNNTDYKGSYGMKLPTKYKFTDICCTYLSTGKYIDSKMKIKVFVAHTKEIYIHMQQGTELC